jgi:ligand-binding sensor domain-containing protein
MIQGVIWIGTAAGLCRFNETTKKFTTFSEKMDRLKV